MVFSATLDFFIRQTNDRPQVEFAKQPPPDGQRKHMEHPGPKHEPFKGIEFFITLTMVSIGVKMTQEWFRSEKIKKELENDKLKAELAALKAQINPHFFFNVMNSLCSLARKKSDDTETYIIKLSEILRYNLNDLSQEKVPVSKELDFIRNYIDIQHLRIPNMKPVEIDIKGNPSSVMMEPMLLFPFVENAFKHGSGGSNPLEVKINLETNGNQLEFTVENTISFRRSEELTEINSGIGITNIRRRLELIYPEKFDLSITEKPHSFLVTLKLSLS